MKNANALLTTWTAPADTSSVLDVFSAFYSSFDTQWHSCVSRKDKREGRRGGEEHREEREEEGGEKMECRRRKERGR